MTANRLNSSRAKSRSGSNIICKRTYIPGNKVNLGSALQVLAVAFVFAVPCSAGASHDTKRFLEFLAGSAEPDPPGPLLSAAGRAEDVKKADVESLATYEEGLHLAHEALVNHGFQSVTLSTNIRSRELNADLYHPRISGLDRSIGRAARILNIYAPEALDTLNICYLEQGVVNTVCYEVDRPKMNRYFSRLISRWQLSYYVKRSEDRPTRSRVSAPEMISEPAPGPALNLGERSPGSMLLVESSAARAEATQLDHSLLTGYSLFQSNKQSLRVRPIDTGRYLNNQYGKFFLDMRSALSLDAYLGAGWSVHSSIFYRWFAPSGSETSDSALPKVRSNLDLYRAGAKAKIDTLYASYTSRVSDNMYFNISLGYQEEMFGGLSSQLYLPKVRECLDLEIRVDWLRQRNIEHPQSFSDYSVTSALLGMRFRWSGLPNDIRLYAGRFLAKDDGVRFDIGHRFSNGMRLAFWYSYTDIDDATGPGSPASPYRGHGITLTLPLNALTMRKDTRKVDKWEYVPHLRDTAQMLDRPVDLSESYVLNSRLGKHLEQFGQ
jgi:hypothetical protein